MVIVLSSFAFLHQIGETLYQPMILARTGSDTKLLGTVVAAAGVGGLIGGGILTLSGGFRTPRRGLLLGMVSGFGMTVLYGLTAAGILTVGIIGRTQLPPLPSLRKGAEKRQLWENL